jgi:succinate dehydrogenase/fumarate reductase flavoprotein subunit
MRYDRTEELDVLVVGAGFAGLYPSWEEVRAYFHHVDKSSISAATSGSTPAS